LAASFYVVALFHRMSLGVASLDAQERFGLSAGTIATVSDAIGPLPAVDDPCGASR
jgi:hypothetical protein